MPTLFPTEDALQIATADFLRLACPLGKDVIWTHVPNGEKRHPSVGKKLKAMGTLAGWPDLTFIWLTSMRGYSIPRLHIAFIELKRLPTTQLKGAQLIFQRWCDRLNIPHAVCWSLGGVETTLRNWSVPIKARLQQRP